jgi:fumarylacetoacetase
MGQYRDKAAQPGSDGQLPIAYGPSRAVDYEMEFAAIIGKPLPMNARLKAVDVDEHIFGFALLNDWSCKWRDFYRRQVKC